MLFIICQDRLGTNAHKGKLIKSAFHTHHSGFDLTNHADDLYLFISSDNHAEGLAGMRKEFLQLSGHVPLLPQWAFGLWFTWYHPYNQSEKTAEVQRFIDDDLGLDVSPLRYKSCMRFRCLLRWYVCNVASKFRRRFQASKNSQASLLTR